jgi:hypothetical protein
MEFVKTLESLVAPTDKPQRFPITIQSSHYPVKRVRFHLAHHTLSKAQLHVAVSFHVRLQTLNNETYYTFQTQSKPLQPLSAGLYFADWTESLIA